MFEQPVDELKTIFGSPDLDETDEKLNLQPQILSLEICHSSLVIKQRSRRPDIKVCDLGITGHSSFLMVCLANEVCSLEELGDSFEPILFSFASP